MKWSSLMKMSKARRSMSTLRDARPMKSSKKRTRNSRRSSMMILSVDFDPQISNPFASTSTTKAQSNFSRTCWTDLLWEILITAEMMWCRKELLLRSHLPASNLRASQNAVSHQSLLRRSAIKKGRSSRWRTTKRPPSMQETKSDKAAVIWKLFSSDESKHSKCSYS